jgi:hypothetical protein
MDVAVEALGDHPEFVPVVAGVASLVAQDMPGYEPAARNGHANLPVATAGRQGAGPGHRPPGEA